MWGCLLSTPNWGPGPQPRHVPWLGIKSATLWFVGQHSVHWATPAKALDLFWTFSVQIFPEKQVLVELSAALLDQTLKISNNSCSYKHLPDTKDGACLCFLAGVLCLDFIQPLYSRRSESLYGATKTKLYRKISVG